MTIHNEMMIVRSNSPVCWSPDLIRKRVAMQKRSTLDRTPVRARASDRMGMCNMNGYTEKV